MNRAITLYGILPRGFIVVYVSTQKHHAELQELKESSLPATRSALKFSNLPSIRHRRVWFSISFFPRVLPTIRSNVKRICNFINACYKIGIVNLCGRDTSNITTSCVFNCDDQSYHTTTIDNRILPRQKQKDSKKNLTITFQTLWTMISFFGIQIRVAIG